MLGGNDNLKHSQNIIFRQFFLSWSGRIGLILFILLWGEPDILTNINQILSVIADFISHSMGGGVG